MLEPMVPFQRLTQELANLNEADLLILLKAVEGLMHTKTSDPALGGQVFQANAVFHRTPSDERMTMDEFIQIIQDLNPAELEIIYHLIPYYFDREIHRDGQQVSATWGQLAPCWRDYFVSVPLGISRDDMQKRDERFKSLIALVRPAQEAKAAGDYQKASELFEQAMNLLKDQGVSGPMLEYLRNLFKN